MLIITVNGKYDDYVIMFFTKLIYSFNCCTKKNRGVTNTICVPQSHKDVSMPNTKILKLEKLITNYY